MVRGPGLCETRQAFLARPDFGFTFDGLHGVSGPYAKRIFGRVRVAASTCSVRFVWAGCFCRIFNANDAVPAGIGRPRSRADELRPPGGATM